MTDIKTRMTFLSAFLVAALAFSGTVVAQEAQEAEAELPPGMTAEAMAAWQKAASPGPGHEMLAAMAGTWAVKGTFRMAADAPSMESVGTAERKMIFGGRVLVEKFTSEWQGQAFEGTATTGFDNVSGVYWGTWIDSMSTGIAISSGSCSEDACEFTSTYNDPMSGGSKTVRMTMTVEADREVHQSFEKGPDGEFMSMELVYTRVE